MLLEVNSAVESMASTSKLISVHSDELRTRMNSLEKLVNKSVITETNLPVKSTSRSIVNF